MKAPSVDYVKVFSLAEALDLLDQHGDRAALLAGGQSLMPMLNMRLAAPEVLIDINGLSDLATIAVTEAGTSIGALVRHVDLERSDEVRNRLPLVHMAVPWMAHPAIRNRGTFGGSIAFADPAAELPACCLALDANIQVANRSQTRTIAAADFFCGLYTTAIRPGEIVLGANFPMRQPNDRSAFAELARRHGDYALVGLAAHGRLNDSRLAGLNLVFFAIGATPVLARRAASILCREQVSRGLIAEAQDALKHDLSPDDSLNTSGDMKLHLARVLLGRVTSSLLNSTPL